MAHCAQPEQTKLTRFTHRLPPYEVRKGADGRDEAVPFARGSKNSFKRNGLSL
jgi:hypothetical protein